MIIWKYKNLTIKKWSDGLAQGIYVTLFIDYQLQCEGAHGVMVIVTGYGHSDTTSIPGQDW